MNGAQQPRPFLTECERDGTIRPVDVDAQRPCAGPARRLVRSSAALTATASGGRGDRDWLAVNKKLRDATSTVKKIAASDGEVGDLARLEGAQTIADTEDFCGLNRERAKGLIGGKAGVDRATDIGHDVGPRIRAAGLQRELHASLRQLGRALGRLHSLAEKTDRIRIGVRRGRRCATRKVRRQKNRDAFLFEAIGNEIRLRPASDDRLHAKLFREVERAFNLALRRRKHHDRLLAGDDALQRVQRRVEIRALHAARIFGVGSLCVAVVLRVEQLLTQRGKHAHQRIREAATTQRREGDVLRDIGLHHHRVYISTGEVDDRRPALENAAPLCGERGRETSALRTGECIGVCVQQFQRGKFRLQTWRVRGVGCRRARTGASTATSGRGSAASTTGCRG